MEDKVDDQLNDANKEDEDDRSEKLTDVGTNSTELKSQVFEELERERERETEREIISVEPD